MAAEWPVLQGSMACMVGRSWEDVVLGLRTSKNRVGTSWTMLRRMANSNKIIRRGAAAQMVSKGRATISRAGLHHKIERAMSSLPTLGHTADAQAIPSWISSAWSRIASCIAVPLRSSARARLARSKTTWLPLDISSMLLSAAGGPRSAARMTWPAPSR